MKKKILSIIGIMLMLSLYSGCGGSDVEATNVDNDDNNTVDYSKDCGFQELFDETKGEFEESLDDNEYFSMIYNKENCEIEIKFIIAGMGNLVTSNYADSTWSTVKSNCDEISSTIGSAFENAGYDVDVILYLLNDEENSQDLYTTVNGVGIYDCMNQ